MQSTEVPGGEEDVRDDRWEPSVLVEVLRMEGDGQGECARVWRNKHRTGGGELSARMGRNL